MSHWLTEIRKKPKHVRDNIAFGVAGGFTALIALLWVVGGQVAVDKGSNNPAFFQTFFSQFKEQLASVKEAVPEPAPEATLPLNIPSSNAFSDVTATGTASSTATSSTNTSSSTTRPVMLVPVNMTATSTN